MTVINRHPNDELLVMASDGLWDVMTNQARPGYRGRPVAGLARRRATARAPACFTARRRCAPACANPHPPPATPASQEACTLAKKCLQRARQRGSSRQVRLSSLTGASAPPTTQPAPRRLCDPPLGPPTPPTHHHTHTHTPPHRSKSAARVAATVLTRAAVDRGSRDNVTVVIVDLSPATEAELAAEAEERRRQETRAASSGAAPAAAQESGEASTSRPPSSGQQQELRDSAALRSGDSGGEGSQAAPAPSPFASQAHRASSPAPVPVLPPSPFAPGAHPPPPPADDPAGGPPLVSPFASGALPEGLEFDGSGHASRVAAGLALQQHRQQQQQHSAGDAEPMQTGK